MTDVDQSIRVADVPERFQLRPGGPVVPLDGEDDELELADEASWICQKALTANTISVQVSKMRLLICCHASYDKQLQSPVLAGSSLGK